MLNRANGLKLIWEISTLLSNMISKYIILKETKNTEDLEI